MRGISQPGGLPYRRLWWLLALASALTACGQTQSLDVQEEVPDLAEAKKLEEGPPLPECPDDLAGLLTAPIVENDKLAVLTPLGNVNPPGHTFPSDHIGLNMGKVFSPGTGYFSPGNGTIIEISLEESYDAEGQKIRSTSRITIALCEGVVVSMGGAEAILAPEIMSVIQAAGKQECAEHPGKHENEERIKVCSVTLEYQVKAGQLLGTIPPRGEWPEVWAFDYNRERAAEIDWERYGDRGYGYAFCFFDLYEGGLRDFYYSKFGFLNTANLPAEYEPDLGKLLRTGQLVFHPRTIEPICGEINQNVAGTVQGNWFGLPRGSERYPGQNTGDLALILDNVDPLRGQIVVAGLVSRAGIVSFDPRQSGTINRQFSEVRADGSIYCYEEDSPTERSIGGKFLVQLVDDHHLRIENQPGSCGNAEAFAKALTYVR